MVQIWLQCNPSPGFKSLPARAFGHHPRAKLHFASSHSTLDTISPYLISDTILIPNSVRRYSNTSDRKMKEFSCLKSSSVRGIVASQGERKGDKIDGEAIALNSRIVFW